MCNKHFSYFILSKLDNHLCFLPFNFCSYYLLAIQIKTVYSLYAKFTVYFGLYYIIDYKHLFIFQLNKKTQVTL